MTNASTTFLGTTENHTRLRPSVADPASSSNATVLRTSASESTYHTITQISLLEEFAKTHHIYLDQRMISILRILPYYHASMDKTLYTLQYTVGTDQTSQVTPSPSQLVVGGFQPPYHIMHQITVTDEGYGYTSNGRKYEFQGVEKLM